jgi:hypothetical protein
MDKKTADFLTEYRAARAKDIAETKIYPSTGWNISHNGRIVFRCPVCKAKVAADVDTSEGPRDEMHHECEACGAEIRLTLVWRIEPELVGVRFERAYSPATGGRGVT